MMNIEELRAYSSEKIKEIRKTVENDSLSTTLRSYEIGRATAYYDIFAKLFDSEEDDKSIDITEFN